VKSATGVVVTGAVSPHALVAPAAALQSTYQHHRFSPRAGRHESAAALRFWWGVSGGVVLRWRRAFGVGRTNCPGSQRLIRQASERGAAAQRGVKLPPEQVERLRRTAVEQNLARNLRPGYNRGPCWTRRESALLGTDDDDVIAARVGRTPTAVGVMRRKRKVPKFRGRRRRR
jgi:hypothetical protein